MITLSKSQLYKFAEAELGETTEVRDLALTNLNNILDCYGREKFDRSLDDHFLLRFLRVSKFDVEKAFGRIKAYFEARKKYEELRDGCAKYEDTEYVAKTGILQAFSNFSIDRCVIVSNVRYWDTERLDINQLFAVLVKCVDRCIDFTEFQILGVRILFDCKGLSLRHFLQFSPSVVFKMVDILLRTLPMRIKSVHFVNENRLLKIAFNMAYPFIPKKIKNRIHFHGLDLESLHQMIDEKVLTPDFGGTGAPLDPEFLLGEYKVVDVPGRLINLYEYNG